MTSAGGNLTNCNGGCGVVFKLAPDSNGGWHETRLWSFGGHPGATPWGGLIFDQTGTLYGTTSGQYTKHHGSVFEITP